MKTNDGRILLGFQGKRWLSLALTTALLGLLMVSVSTCQTAAQPSQQPPHLLGLIKGRGPEAITLGPNGYAYVINMGGEPGTAFISVLDGARLVANIPWPDERSFGVGAQIAVHPQTGLVYVVDTLQNQLYVIRDTQVITTMQVGYALRQVAIDPISNLVYVTNETYRPQVAGVSPGPGDIAVISGTQVITHVVAGRPVSLGINPVDGRIYVGQHIGFPSDKVDLKDRLVAIEGTKRVHEPLYPWNHHEDGIGGGVYEIAVNQSTGDMYLVLGYGTLVYWHDKTPHLLDLGSLGYSINTLAVDSRKNWAYVASWEKLTSHVIVVNQDKIVTAIPVGEDVRGIAVDATHDYVYATNYRSDTLSVIRDTQVITTLTTGGLGPWAIAVDEKRGYVYVVNSNSASIAVFGFDQPVDKPSFWQTFLPWLGK